MVLISEGERHPRVELIAERAGAGTRTVYNQFRDLEGLRAEVWNRLSVELAAFDLADVIPEAPLQARVSALVEQRVAFYEVLTPYALSAQGLHAHSAELRRQRTELIDRGRRELSWLFAPELDRCLSGDRRRLLAALQSATSWQVWIGLRDELDLNWGEAGLVMGQTLHALLRC
jgi:AcrR family transcriptional regulator